MILDILYEIVNDGEDLERQIKILRNVVSIYNNIKKDEKQIEVKKLEKNDWFIFSVLVAFSFGLLLLVFRLFGQSLLHLMP